MENSLSEKLPNSSSTLTVKVLVPKTPGVPEKLPDEFIDKPVGSEPLIIEYVSDEFAAPEVAEMLVLYD
jgi:hypothetical protein